MNQQKSASRALRSNSIKCQSSNMNGGMNFRLNSKRFPVDFFVNHNIPNFKNPLTPSIQKQGCKTQRKTSSCLNSQSFKHQQLPQAQVTSCFKINLNESDTTDSTAFKNQAISSETNIGVSELQCIIAKEISNSIQLIDSSKNQGINDFCCTFSKIPVSRSKYTTPEKRREKPQKNEQNKSSIEKRETSKLKRHLSRLEPRNANFTENRKNSIQKMESLKISRDLEQANITLQKHRKRTEDLLFPVIGKFQF